MSRYILVTTNWANVIVRKISLNANKFFTTIFYIEQQYIVHTKMKLKLTAILRKKLIF